MQSRLILNATKRWNILRSAKAGERFEKAYESRFRDRGLECWTMRNRMLAGGFTLVIAGMVAWFWAPTAALALTAIGGLLGARESLQVAQWLDSVDERRAGWMRAHRIDRLRARGAPAPPHNWVVARAALAGAAVVALILAW
jgi:hypothetical protein